MIATQDSIDERERGWQSLEEERVEVTAYEAIKSCELDGCESLDIIRCYMSVLKDEV